MKQYLKYWCSPGYPSDPSNDPPATYMYIYYYKVCMYVQKTTCAFHTRGCCPGPGRVRPPLHGFYRGPASRPLCCSLLYSGGHLLSKKIEICINKLKCVQKLYFLVLKVWNQWLLIVLWVERCGQRISKKKKRWVFEGIVQLLPRHTFFFQFFITISTISAIVEKMMKNQFLHQGQDQENFFFFKYASNSNFFKEKKIRIFFWLR